MQKNDNFRIILGIESILESFEKKMLEKVQNTFLEV